MTDTMEQCPHSDFCGGCTYQGIPYAEQLADKEQQVLRLLEKEGIAPDETAAIAGCPADSTYRYRNKMEYTFGDLVKDGPLCLGMHKIRNFMSVITVDHCQIVPLDFNRILGYTLDFCSQRGYVKYHKKLHRGLLRNLIVRWGVHTGELLVNIVTTTESSFDDQGWLNGLEQLALDNRIVGVMHTYSDALADAVKPESMEVLRGREYYIEKIQDLSFKVHEFSFFQTNVDAASRLYREGISLIENIEGKSVFDLYCGTGTISQIMAEKAGHVLGVEIVPESVDSARENAALNGLANCEFICGDVFQVLQQRSDKPDVIVVDPPRVGMSVDAVDKIASYGVTEILYISCNPKTLVKNLVQFQNLGYHVRYLRPYDNFPMTKHVETVVLMSRVKGE